MGTLSVVIPTYNRLSLLRETLESLSSQRKAVDEIIVVDDGSTDGTVECLQNEYPEVRVFKQENLGPGAARNHGVLHARGDYIAFLDSDDCWLPWAAELIGEVVKSTSPAIVFLKPEPFEDAFQDLHIEEQSLSFETFDDYLFSGDEMRWHGVSSFVIQRSLLKDAKFFEEAWNAEDADLMMQLGDVGKVVQIKEPNIYGFRQHSGSLTEDLEKCFLGIQGMLERDEQGLYPGGAERAGERWRILGRHLRPLALACLKNKRKKEAWELYRSSLRPHLKENRWKFILGFLMVALVSVF